MNGFRNRIITGECRQVLRGMPEESVQAVVTSPPYWGLRDYGLPPTVWGGDPGCDHVWESCGHLHRGGPQGPTGERSNRSGIPAQNAAQHIRVGDRCRCGAWRGQLGLEPDPWLYLDHLVEVFREVRRVLRPDGVLWLNLGDSYATGANSGRVMGGENGKHDPIYESGAIPRCQPNRMPIEGLKAKDLIGLPWRAALALQADGWWLRQALPWIKRSAMPEPARDRPVTTVEYVFLLTKSRRYFYDHVAAMRPSSSRTLLRLQQNIEAQQGSFRANGGTRANRSMRAVGGARRPLRSTDLFFDSLEPPHGAVSGEGGFLALDVPGGCFKGAHFASFPTSLVEPLLRAATSEAGACPGCGAPWERITAKGRAHKEWRRACGSDASGTYRGQAVKDYDVAGVQNASEIKARVLSGMREVVTVAWRKPCRCDFGPPAPCLVLDPFGGSGAVGVAAQKMGLDFVLIELSEEYTGMSLDRIRADLPLFTKARRRC